MSFGNFLRRISFDSDKGQSSESASAEAGEGSGLTNIFAAPGRLFESVKTGNLVSDLNQKLDISGKFDSIKQASVGTFEQVYRGAPVRHDGKSSDLPKSTFDSPSHGTNTAVPSNLVDSQRAPLDNPFNERNKPQLQQQHWVSSQSMESKSGKEEYIESAETEKATNVIRRQSTNAGVRPPRPPPPSSSALSRAMSLDESNLPSKSYTHVSCSNVKTEPILEEDKPQSYHGSKSGKEHVSFKGLDMPRKIRDDDDDEDSSASEYGADGDKPIYKQEPQVPENPATQQTSIYANQMTGKQVDVSEIETSVLSPEKTKQLQEFIDIYVSALTSGRSDYLAGKESEIQETLATSFGRQTFVNNLERESSRTQGFLDTHAIPKLLDQISLLLAECQTAEDFAPAKKLLTTSLLFYTYDPNISADRTFLFAYIKNQPIWQSLRFWNACFFQSLQEARSKLGDNPESDKKLGNLAYDQLKSYLNTMNVFNLHQTIQQEFLRKQADLFNLTDDEFNSLRSIISSED